MEAQMEKCQLLGGGNSEQISRQILDTCKAYCKEELDNYFCYVNEEYKCGQRVAQPQKYWVCIGKTNDGWLVVRGKICVGEIKPKHRECVVYKSDSGYGVIQGRVKHRKEIFAMKVTREAVRVNMHSDYLNSLTKKDVHRNDSVGGCIGAWIAKECCAYGRWDKIRQIADGEGNIFSDSAADEFIDALERANKGEEAVRAVNDIANLCSDIYRVMDRLVTVGCCGVNKNTNGSDMGVRYVAQRFKELVKDGQGARLYPACRKCCVDVLKKFAYQRVCRINSGLRKNWGYFEKTKYGYVVISLEMYEGKVKPEHKNSIMCAMQDIGYSFISGCFEFERENLAVAVVRQSVKEFAMWTIRDAEETSWIKGAIVRSIAKHIEKEIKCNAITAMKYGARELRNGKAIRKLFNEAAIIEFVDAWRSVKAWCDAVSGSMTGSVYNVIDKPCKDAVRCGGMPNLYGSIYKVMDELCKGRMLHRDADD